MSAAQDDVISRCGALRLTPTNSNNVLRTAGGCATIAVVLLRIFHERRFVLIVLVSAAVVERK